MTPIGERLRQERDRLGFNQTAFGAIGGVKKQAQLKYEKGDRLPDAGYLAEIAKVGADIQYIVTGQLSQVALSADEEELLTSYRAAGLAVKAAAIGALQGGTGASHVDKSVNVSAPGGNAAGRDMTIERK